MTPKALVITGYGVNSCEELAHAFRLAGAEADRLHVNDVIADPSMLGGYHIVGFPGGFSFGDHLGSGRALSNLVKQSLKPGLEKFIREGKLVIGICNGFQTLAKLGIVPNMAGTWETEVSLLHNERAAYLDMWVKVSFAPGTECVWTKGLTSRDLPIRHGEGRFYAPPETLLELENRHLVAVRYEDGNPNGAFRGIAGITDPSGRVLGLMPHPEAFLIPEHHPEWYRSEHKDTGLDIFRNAVEYAKANL